jgi:hypothetical protein
MDAHLAILQVLVSPMMGYYARFPRSLHTLDDILLVPTGWTRNGYLPVFSSAAFWYAGV